MQQQGVRSPHTSLDISGDPNSLFEPQPPTDDDVAAIQRQRCTRRAMSVVITIVMAGALGMSMSVPNQSKEQKAGCVTGCLLSWFAMIKTAQSWQKQRKVAWCASLPRFIITMIVLCALVIYYYIFSSVQVTCITLNQVVGTTTSLVECPLSITNGIVDNNGTSSSSSTLSCIETAFIMDLDGSCTDPELVTDDLASRDPPASWSMDPDGVIHVVYNASATGETISFGSQSLRCSTLRLKMCLSPFQLPPLVPPADTISPVSQHKTTSQRVVAYFLATSAYGSAALGPLIRLLGLTFWASLLTCFRRRYPNLCPVSTAHSTTNRSCCCWCWCWCCPKKRNNTNTTTTNQNRSSGMIRSSPSTVSLSSIASPESTHSRRTPNSFSNPMTSPSQIVRIPSNANILWSQSNRYHIKTPVPRFGSTKI